MSIIIHCAVSQSPCPLLFLYFYQCLCLLSVCTHVWHLYICVCSHSREEWLIFFSNTFTLFLWGNLSHCSASKMAISRSHRYSCLCSKDEDVGACVPCLNFYFGSGDYNSSPYTFVQEIFLLKEPSHQPPFFFSCYLNYFLMSLPRTISI